MSDTGEDALDENLTPGERLRRLRLAQIEAANEMGRWLIANNGGDKKPRQRFATAGHSHMKTRRHRG